MNEWIQIELKGRVLELLAKSEPMRLGEIANALGVDKKDLEKVIKQLKNNITKNMLYSIEK